MKIWILTANASTASLFTVKSLLARTVEKIETIEHPTSRKMNSELTANQPGAHPSGNSAHTSAYEQATDPKKVEADVFAKALSDKLLFAFKEKRFDKLVLAASPEFLGLLKRHLKDHIPGPITIPKDYTQATEKELPKLLMENLV